MSSPTTRRCNDEGARVPQRPRPSSRDEARRFEWTPLYFKELHIVGSNAFGIENRDGNRKHAFEHYFDLVRAGVDRTPLITHRFLLTCWQDAVLAIANRATTGSIKVLLEPSPRPPST